MENCPSSGRQAMACKREQNYTQSDFWLFLPRHVGLDNVAHLPNVAFAVSGQKDVVQVFVHVSLAHSHPVDIINIICDAQMLSGGQRPKLHTCEPPCHRRPSPLRSFRQGGRGEGQCQCRAQGLWTGRAGRRWGGPRRSLTQGQTTQTQAAERRRPPRRRGPGFDSEVLGGPDSSLRGDQGQ